MSSIVRYAFILALSFGCAGFSSAVRAQTKPQQKLPPNSVSGRVTIHGKAAPGIVVGIRSTDFPGTPTPGPKATTDQDGNYRITDLPPGGYQISPIAPTFVTTDLAVSQARGKTLLLASGEDIQGIDFSLVRGGVITGKVRDADGRPIVDERVNLVSEDKGQTRGRTFAPWSAGTFQTDDRGVYRIYGIPAGRYKVSIGVGEDDPSNYRPGRFAYVRTYYPDAAESDKAELVEVQEGAELANIDITVGRGLPGYAASGKVVDGETGQPAAGLRLGLQRVVNNHQAGGMGMFVTSNSLGEFRLDNITPGKYVVLTAPQPGNEVRAESLPFEVIDQDVTGLLVKTIKGLTITGNVVLEGTYDRSVYAKLAQLRLRAYVRSEKAFSGSWQETPLNSDGSFRLGGLGAGTVIFSLSGPDRRQSVAFAILRVEREGAELPRGLELKPEEPANGVRLIVSYGSGSVRGEVKLQNGELPAGARVVIWMNKLGAQRTRPYIPDARGHFLIEGVAAGSYEINANINVPGKPGRPPTKVTIEVSEGAVTDVVITLDLKADPDPAPTATSNNQ